MMYLSRRRRNIMLQFFPLFNHFSFFFLQESAFSANTRAFARSGARIDTNLEKRSLLSKRPLSIKMKSLFSLGTQIVTDESRECLMMTRLKRCPRTRGLGSMF